MADPIVDAILSNQQNREFWQGTLRNLVQTIAQIPQMREQALERQALVQDRFAQAQDRQAMLQERQQKAADLKQMDQLLSSPDGRAAILSRAPGHLQGPIAKIFEDIDKSNLEYQQNREKGRQIQQNSVARRLLEVRDIGGYDPQFAQAALTELKKSYPDDQEFQGQMQRFEDQLHQNPSKEFVQKAVDSMLMQSEEARKALEAQQKAEKGTLDITAATQKTTGTEPIQPAQQATIDAQARAAERAAAATAETARHNREMERVGLIRATRPTAAQAAAPADQDVVSYWVKQVTNDPTQWNMLANNKPLQQAVQAGLAKQGTDINKLSAQSRAMKETAKEILPHIDTIEKEAKDLDAKGLMGPLRGRWRDLVAGKIGATSLVGPQNAAAVGKFQTDLGLLMTAVARAHGGARGGGSPMMLEHMKSIMDAHGKDLDLFLGNLASTRDWMQGYSQMGENRSETGGSSSPGDWIDLGGGIRVRKKG